MRAVAKSPDSWRRTLAPAKTRRTITRTKLLCRKSGTQWRRKRKMMTAAPRAPRSVPTRRMVPAALRMGSGVSWPETRVLKDDDRDHGAQGIDDDAFPLEDRADFGGGADVAEEWSDDGGSGDDEDGAEEDGEGPVEAEEEVGGEGGDGEGDGGAESDEEPDGGAGGLVLAEVEGEAAFKEDEGDGERDGGEEEVAEEVGGVEEGLREDVEADEEVGAGAKKESGDKEKEDGGEARAPGEPLDGDAEDEDPGELKEDGVGHACSTKAAWGR